MLKLWVMKLFSFHQWLILMSDTIFCTWFYISRHEVHKIFECLHIVLMLLLLYTLLANLYITHLIFDQFLIIFSFMFLKSVLVNAILCSSTEMVEALLNVFLATSLMLSKFLDICL